MAEKNGRMPALFVGHGSPMNAIENNAFTAEWVRIANEIPKPSEILSISAHWFTRGSFITDAKSPETIYDFYGFPEELYEVKYRPDGEPSLAHTIKDMINKNISINNDWGIDHGSWSVLSRMYPDADIPVVQLSIDLTATPEEHFKIGREIRELRDNGVMIFGSGNIVHNLSEISWDTSGGFAWADEFDEYIRTGVLSRDFESILNYGNAGLSAEKSFNTPDHFFPLLYVLGASYESDSIRVFNNSRVMGSVSMTGYILNDM